MLLVLTTLSANFLYQNYRQALHILEHEEYAVSVVEITTGCNCQDFPQFLQEELVSQQPQSRPTRFTAQIEYANALKWYYEIKYVLLQALYG